MTEEQVQYVQNCLDEGYTQEAIEESLLAAGYTGQQIKELLVAGVPTTQSLSYQPEPLSLSWGKKVKLYFGSVFVLVGVFLVLLSPGTVFQMYVFDWINSVNLADSVSNIIFYSTIYITPLIHIWIMCVLFLGFAQAIVNNDTFFASLGWAIRQWRVLLLLIPIVFLLAFLFFLSLLEFATSKTKSVYVASLDIGMLMVITAVISVCGICLGLFVLNYVSMQGRIKLAILNSAHTLKEQWVQLAAYIMPSALLLGVTFLGFYGISWYIEVLQERMWAEARGRESIGLGLFNLLEHGLAFLIPLILFAVYTYVLVLLMIPAILLSFVTGATRFKRSFEHK